MEFFHTRTIDQDMSSSPGVKIRACFDLIRIDLAVGAGLFLIAGEIIATGGLLPIPEMILGFLTLFFISGSANISNDYFDREVDQINLSTRPLPSGRISIRELWALFSLFTISGFITAVFLGTTVLIIVIVLWAVALLYNMKFKESGFFGNLCVAFCLGMIFVLAGVLVDNLNGTLIIFAFLAFFFDLGEEIACDALDMAGDEVRSTRSIAKKIGIDRAMMVASGMFGIFILLTFVLFLMNWVWYDYLLLALVLDVWIIRCVLKLMRSQSIADSRVLVRSLYLSWGLFVFVFAVSRLII